jgi:hypothetical protein
MGYRKSFPDGDSHLANKKSIIKMDFLCPKGIRYNTIVCYQNGTELEFKHSKFIEDNPKKSEFLYKYFVWSRLRGIIIRTNL